MDPKTTRRLFRAAHTIHGWFSLEAAMLFAWLDEIQKTRGTEGPLFEIGVHHGKSAVLLGAMARPGREHLGVCDLFGRQAANLSGSGAGDRERFERNVRRLVPGPLDLRIFARPSAELTPGEIGGGYRFFHVDGGHNADEALGDLRLGAAVLGEAGLLVVDDPFRPEWPGVTEAILRFLDADPRFSAIAIGFNKLVIARLAQAAPYVAEIDRRERRVEFGIADPWQLKELPFLGRALRIFYVPSSRRDEGRLARLRRALGH